MRRFSKPSIRAFTASLFVLSALSVIPACRRKNKSPNVIIVLVDSLRADYLGCYGFDGSISPGIDRLAAQSVRFDNAITPAVRSQPAVASLFTGMPPDALGEAPAQNRGVPVETAFSSSVLTMAEAFRSAGYHAGAFVADPWIAARWGFDRGFDTFDDVGSLAERPDAALVSSHALRWVAGQKDAPFFLFVDYLDVHGPYRQAGWAPSTVLDSPTLGLDRELTAAELARRAPYLIEARPANFRDAKERLVSWKRLYARGVSMLDRDFSGFMLALRRSGFLDDTIVIFLSDHGEELLDHGAWEHGTSLYRETVRVPLLIRLPNGRSAGRVVFDPVSLADLFPTLARWIGLDDDVPGAFDRDFSALLTADKSVSDGRPVVSVADSPGEPRSRAIQDGRYQLIVPGNSAKRPALFDVVADPWEKFDRAAEQSGIAGRLADELAEKISSSKSQRQPRAKVTMTRDEAEKLEALVPFQ